MSAHEERSFEKMNETLVDVFNNVMWIEEASLRKSRFKDISIKDMHTIAAITMYDTRTASQLAQMMHLTPSAMTSVIDKLEKKGYVVRNRDTKDRRVVRIGLTHKGRTVFRAHEAFHRGMTHSLFDSLEKSKAPVVEEAIEDLQEYLHELIQF
ncbi:MarR family winged helix-turn-helix transcriptional regulator [Weissella sagaensis]|jgi:DNA-binding MarR family transcriptional regulator|uniref:MarR family winged helix-turn-helix transcriptional regulator n=1 Tax=Weissella sagaensis TaxID=2559928 RepID=A0ABW1RRU0_9LACO|nr:MarR family transcriptional regulator [Weissella sagaensis]KAA8432308.1 MarR family transcriptional regulator [Weissella paramesenteroides]MBU7568464.1 MarR family transcriptional regulator [Weissella hellenica]KAA8439424.1 MarR family transcriptional regulator [Weissella paramesenteroides]QDJ58531.1 MarR family transcriptional regulator [Weissella hellenica]QEA57472.1 MarR family transcriptional regulator [Weissella hellenica]